MTIPRDRHVRRNGAAYAEALANLLPTGLAWPRESDTVLMRTVRGLGEVWGAWVDHRAADLLEQETDPRLTFEMLTDWERAWGLPWPCIPAGMTIQQRRDQLLWAMTLMGGQSRAFFIAVAALLGYTIMIYEYAPFMVGVSQCGETRDLDMAPNKLVGPLAIFTT